MKVENKIAWVTGASSGIGEALAYSLSARGARVILSSRRMDKLEEVRENCTNPDQHLSVFLDLADPKSIDDATKTVLDHFGQIDILFNNGGLSQRSLAMDTSLEVDRNLMEINYFGTITLTKAVLPAMLERKEGHIVVVSSLMGKMASPVRSGYAASKHALHGFFDALRAETHDAGIRITMVCPGFVNTQISINALKGDGSPANTMDDAVAAGLSSEACANKIIRGVEKNRAQMIIAGKERIGIYLNALLPSLYNYIIRKVDVT